MQTKRHRLHPSIEGTSLPCYRGITHRSQYPRSSRALQKADASCFNTIHT